MFLTWPTTSTALPTLTDTGNGLSSVSNVTNILGSKGYGNLECNPSLHLGCIAVARP